MRRTISHSQPPSRDEAELETARTASELMKADLTLHRADVRDLKEKHEIFKLDTENEREKILKDHASFLQNTEQERQKVQEDISHIHEEIENSKKEREIIYVEIEKTKKEHFIAREELVGAKNGIEDTISRQISIEKEILESDKILKKRYEEITEISERINLSFKKIEEDENLLIKIDLSINSATEELVETRKNLATELSNLFNAKEEVTRLFDKKALLISEIENFDKIFSEKKIDLEQREKKAIEREKAATLLVTTLDQKIASVKTMGDISVLKEFLKEVLNK